MDAEPKQMGLTLKELASALATAEHILGRPKSHPDDIVQMARALVWHHEGRIQLVEELAAQNRERAARQD